MHDRFGRPLIGIRVSVISDCNLNCFYCHSEGCSSGNRQMTAEEIGEAVGLAAEFGVRKVKLTGGEPLLRDDILEVLRAIPKPPIEEVSMATNGTLLEGLAHELKEAGLDRVNISLDTLNPETYASITGKPMLEDAIAGVEAAQRAGLKPLKINMVLLKGINDGEVDRMFEYASSKGAILQLIELVRTPLNEQGFASFHLDLEDIERKFGERALSVETRQTMHARRKYLLPEGEVEFVRPMHNSEFCMHCTRLRLTPDGYLKPCLLRSDNLVDLLSHLRAGETEKARAAFEEAIARREPFFRG
jgi:cyclic pyranopterin phosphate synthase